VNTKHGPVKTDHVCSSAPARSIWPSRPTCCPAAGPPADPGQPGLATQDDFPPQPDEPEASLVKQYKALLATEKVELEFKQDAIDELASSRPTSMSPVENIGARRCNGMEKLLEEISFTASDSRAQRSRSTRLCAREGERV